MITKTATGLRSINNSTNDEGDHGYSIHRVSRRAMIHWGFKWGVYSMAASAATVLSSSPQVAAAANEAQGKIQSNGLLTTLDVADLLRPIPTFTIVDEKGVPFMVVGEDAKVVRSCAVVSPRISQISTIDLPRGLSCLASLIVLLIKQDWIFLHYLP
jgi:hypothetical protein